MGKNIFIVIGLGFGDEGKGATVNSLCANKPSETLVIRFNGGHQVGHTVRHKDILHPFSNFGSGTLQDVPTYWTEYCTVNPVAVIKEGLALRDHGIAPWIIFNANAMVTTPFDIFKNLSDNANKSHGTVGVGFGATIQRNEDHYHLYVRDLLYPKIRDAKLKNILNYLGFTTPLNKISQQHYDTFVDACTMMIERYAVVDSFDDLKMWDRDIIFEGGQGIMLDTEYGFFPHVTRSYTTSRNAIEFIKKNNLDSRFIKTYYVTRAYQTRHGNGPMTNEGMDISYIKSNPTETNVDSGYQGNFRKSVLDIDLLKYAISCDRYHNPNSLKKLVITCCDQIDGNLIPATYFGQPLQLSPKEIAKYCEISEFVTTESDRGFLLY